MQKPSAFSLQPQRLLLGILILITWAYLPSLGEIARGDQWGYVADQARVRDFASLAFKSYAYNRDRQFIPGDEILFRPIFYFMLGVEKWFFGYHFAGWQAVGIFLHLLVIWQFFKLLELFDLGIWGGVLAGFVGTLFSTLEMVTWHNIHAYLLFAICILAALRNVWQYGRDGRRERLAAITLWVFIATLCYETALPFAILISGYLAFAKRTNRAFALLPLAPVFIYILASVGDFYFFKRHFPEGGHILHGIQPLMAVKQWLHAVSFWVFSGLFSTRDMFFYSPLGKMAVYSLPAPNPFFPDGPGMVDDAARALGFFILFLFPFCLAMVRQKLRLQPIRENRGFLFLLVLMICVYVLVIVLGRFNSRGVEETLFTNLYDGYMFWVLVVVLGGCGAGLMFKGLGWPSAVKKLMGILILILIFCNAWRIHQVCGIVEKQSRAIRRLVVESEDFVRSHGDERNFTFSIKPSLPGNPLIRGLRRKDDPPDKNYTVLEVLFPDAFKLQGGAYFFDGKSWKKN